MKLCVGHSDYIARRRSQMRQPIFHQYAEQARVASVNSAQILSEGTYHMFRCTVTAIDPEVREVSMDLLSLYKVFLILRETGVFYP